MTDEPIPHGDEKPMYVFLTCVAIGAFIGGCCWLDDLMEQRKKNLKRERG